MNERNLKGKYLHMKSQGLKHVIFKILCAQGISVSIRSISGRKAQSAEFKMLFLGGEGGGLGAPPLNFWFYPPPPSKVIPNPLEPVGNPETLHTDTSLESLFYCLLLLQI